MYLENLVSLMIMSYMMYMYHGTMHTSTLQKYCTMVCKLVMMMHTKTLESEFESTKRYMFRDYFSQCSVVAFTFTFIKRHGAMVDLPPVCVLIITASAS
mmetsp:Transcript_18730/g.37533  ORF Transcript_18730/g.37533 Transcript_18730/m.37533 type:complete len:99 (+) Transcript_18730:236-532(+)